MAARVDSIRITKLVEDSVCTHSSPLNYFLRAKLSWRPLFDLLCNHGHQLLTFAKDQGLVFPGLRQGTWTDDGLSSKNLVQSTSLISHCKDYVVGGTNHHSFLLYL